MSGVRVGVGCVGCEESREGGAWIGGGLGWDVEGEVEWQFGLKGCIRGISKPGVRALKGGAVFALHAALAVESRESQRRVLEAELRYSTHTCVIHPAQQSCKRRVAVEVAAPMHCVRCALCFITKRVVLCASRLRASCFAHLTLRALCRTPPHVASSTRALVVARRLNTADLGGDWNLEGGGREMGWWWVCKRGGVG